MSSKITIFKQTTSVENIYFILVATYFEVIFLTLLSEKHEIKMKVLLTFVFPCGEKGKL
jgi:hypothetical protein